MSFRKPILLVDDDPAVLQSLGFWLEAEGYSVIPFARPELLMKAALPREGLLVVDQRLPGMSGLDLLARLRESRYDYPAVLITTAPSEDLLQSAALAGVRVVEKPLVGAELLDIIRSMA
jgi:two-component system response regulator FixJ